MKKKKILRLALACKGPIFVMTNSRDQWLGFRVSKKAIKEAFNEFESNEETLLTFSVNQGRGFIDPK
jgi:hypothetical protein